MLKYIKYPRDFDDDDLKRLSIFTNFSTKFLDMLYLIEYENPEEKHRILYEYFFQVLIFFIHVTVDEEIDDALLESLRYAYNKLNQKYKNKADNELDGHDIEI